MLRFFLAVTLFIGCSFANADDANRLTHLDDCNPWYPDHNFPSLITPQWVGEAGVECVVVLAIDDMRDSAKYEHYLRPILDRLKQIDGRAPVSIMTCDVKPDDPQLQSWLEEGLSIECHTVDHPCPLLQGGDFDKAKSTYDRCIDLLNMIPGNKPVAFRTPCCDSLNTVSPRFYSEIFPRTTPEGNDLQIDSSVMNFYTSDDESNPRELVLDENGNERFWKYKVKNLKQGETVHNNFVNYIKNYPYPYVINNTCWQFPCVAPSDWSAQHLHGINNQQTVDDWKAALDITVHKQGVFNLIFHPHGWITAQQINELIDHAVTKHGRKVKFLTFREAAARLNKTFGERPLRSADASVLAEASHAEFRQNHFGSTDQRSAPAEVTSLIESGMSSLALRRDDGSHNGVFVRDDHLCCMNEDTADQPDLIRRVSFDQLRAEFRRHEARDALPSVPIGAAVIDITPDYPVRLTGYGNRLAESEGAAAKIHARALAIGGHSGQPVASASDGRKPIGPTSITSTETVSLSHHGLAQAIMVTVDNCGVPASVTEAVFAKVAAKHNIPRERFAISSTHTHSGPWLRDFAPNIFADIPADHAVHLQQYELSLIEKLVEVVDQAIAVCRPGHLSLGYGELGFAMNRRTIANGQWTGFGEVGEGPTDKRFPLLAAYDTEGKLIAVLANYACHATTETGSFNQISGDWPGFAAEMIEADLREAGNDNVVALIAIGCGGDANPSPRGTHEQAKQHGRSVADEVKRLLAKSGRDSAGTSAGNEKPSGLQRINSEIVCDLARVDLPLGPVPSRDELERAAEDTGVEGSRARYFLKMLDDGEPVPATVPDYPVQTWCFGDDLAMVFLGGEVVVDYSIRMNEMFDGDRLWINAYSNDVPCYIASKRILREGGYEADSSMRYYRQPTRLAPEAEDIICDAVQKLLPHHFYSKELQASFPAPKSPEQSLAAITVRPGLKVELVAAEPQIHDPVAFDWDVNGRLWVVEMGGYPAGAGMTGRQVARGVGETPTSNLPSSGDERAKGPDVAQGGYGRVQVLEDTDGDGRYDKATTFMDGLSFPTGLHPWRNGWLITCAPDIIYAEDTDGDFVADKRTVLYTGFAEGNQQHRVNGLRWGLEGWLYLGNGDSGGDISVLNNALSMKSEASESRINIRGRDLRIQPDTGGIETVSGQTQFGRERDDFGNWFGNNNSNPIWHYVLEDSYLRRNAHATDVATRAEIAEVSGAAPVFPTSITLARFNDFHAANRFTSACSTSIYRDTLLGKQFYGNAFTCEPVHNLVSRLILERDGVTFKAHRAADETDSEFFASSDNWTRPVMVRTGPDGALYVADMYRQVIEHPQWIPAEYQRKMNLYAGNTMGRIYRVVPVRTDERELGKSANVGKSNNREGGPEEARNTTSSACCGLGSEGRQLFSDVSRVGEAVAAVDVSVNSDKRTWFGEQWDKIQVEGLVGRLASPNGWWRDTVQRLLLHANKDEVAVNRIIELALSNKDPAVRIQALWTLSQVGEDRPHNASLFTKVLSDPYAEVRRTAVQLLEDWLQNPVNAPSEQMRHLVNDSSPVVRRQLALSLGASPHIEAAKLLAKLLQNNADSSQIVGAVMTSLTPDNVSTVLKQLAETGDASNTQIWQLVGQASSMKQLQAVADASVLLLKSLSVDASSTNWIAAANAMPAVIRGSGTIKDNAEVQQVLAAARGAAASIALNAEQPVGRRTASLQFLSSVGGVNDDSLQLLLGLFQPLVPSEVQQAAIPVVVRSRTSIEALISDWRSITPSVRNGIVSSLLQNPDSTQQLLVSVAAGELMPADIAATARDQLLNSRTDSVRFAAAKLFGESTPTARSSVVETMKSELTGLKTDAAAGRAVFEKRCSVCHRLQDIGKQIGADLAALKDRSTDALLTAILDPNKAVEAKFLSYTAVTNDGRSFNGMLLNETGNSLTLLGTDGKEQVVGRSDLDELVCSNRSLMPEGLEKDMSAQDLTNVISFVQSQDAAVWSLRNLDPLSKWG